MQAKIHRDVCILSWLLKASNFYSEHALDGAQWYCQKENIFSKMKEKSCLYAIIREAVENVDFHNTDLVLRRKLKKALS